MALQALGLNFHWPHLSVWPSSEGAARVALPRFPEGGCPEQAQGLLNLLMFCQPPHVLFWAPACLAPEQQQPPPGLLLEEEG